MWPCRLFVLHPKPSGTHQPLPRQTGPQVTLNEPNEGLWVRQDFQKEVAANLLTIPLSAISGTLLPRSGQVSIDHFNAEISDEFPDRPPRNFGSLDAVREFAQQGGDYDCGHRKKEGPG